MKYPYTADCRAAGHRPYNGERACRTCQKRASRPRKGATMKEKEALDSWGDEVCDVLILLLESGLNGRPCPFSSDYLQSLIEGRPSQNT